MSSFARALRRYDFPAGPDAVLDGLRALNRIDLSRRDDVRAALRAVFVDAPEQIPLFDALFDRIWAGAVALPPPQQAEEPAAERPLGLAAEDLAGDDAEIIPVGGDDEAGSDDAGQETLADRQSTR